MKQLDPLAVLESTLPHVENSQYVKISEPALKVLEAKTRKRIESGLPDGSEEFFRFGDKDKDVQIVFLENVVNFCFWAEKGKEKWKVEFGGKEDDGASALRLVFERAIKEGVPILEADFLEKLTLEQTKEIFRPSNKVEIPLIENRHKNLVEAGKVLKNEFNGLFINLLEKANYDAVEITKLTIKYFSSFDDSYGGVNFYKRAQLNAFDAAQIKGVEIKNTDYLTAMADYKLPQLLRYLGVLQYSQELVVKVDNYELIKSGTVEEIEIRSNTIWAIEKVSRNLNISPGLADRAIWWLSRELEINQPYHRTYSIYY